MFRTECGPVDHRTECGPVDHGTECGPVDPAPRVLYFCQPVLDVTMQTLLMERQIFHKFYSKYKLQSKGPLGKMSAVQIDQNEGIFSGQTLEPQPHTNLCC